MHQNKRDRSQFNVQICCYDLRMLYLTDTKIKLLVNLINQLFDLLILGLQQVLLRFILVIISHFLMFDEFFEIFNFFTEILSFLGIQPTNLICQRNLANFRRLVRLRGCSRHHSPLTVQLLWIIFSSLEGCVESFCKV